MKKAQKYMSRFYQNILIISPHSDDEIFTLPFIYSKDISFNSIDLLLIENDPKRSKEALLSAKIHSFNLILMPKSYNFQGLSFHKKVDKLIRYFSDLWGKYDLILAPLLEGGHQDHDTVCLSLFLSRELSKENSKLILYSTYNNYRYIPWIYKCGISKGMFSNYLYIVRVPKNIIYLFFKTILLCYRSQLKTWILLLPALFLSMIKLDYRKFVLADNLKIEDLIIKMPNKPLYEIYRGLRAKDWLISIKEKTKNKKLEFLR